MKTLIFFAVIVPTIALLYFSLTRNPRDLPSVLVQREAPPFELTTLEGETISLKSAIGQPVILNFWSTWCGPCVVEHRVIQEAIRRYAQSGVLFYSILYEDTPENARQFLAKYGKAAPVLVDPNLRTAIDYGVTGVPETFFIDRTGKIVYKHAGPLTPGLVTEKIDPEARAERIGSQLRCPVCRGVPIADSPAALAQEMMTLVRQQVAEGKSDEEIFRYFEERYGEWALLRPKAEGINLVVWILPILFLVGGTGLILFRLKRRPV